MRRKTVRYCHAFLTNSDSNRNPGSFTGDLAVGHAEDLRLRIVLSIMISHDELAAFTDRSIERKCGLRLDC